MIDKCKKCYENNKTPDKNDCKKCQEVITDGVNVAGCEFYDNGCCRECDMRVPFYSDIDCYDKCNKNCHYKQLKRLEQENAELKERLKNLDEEEVVYEVTETEYNNFKKYKQALEEIRGIAEIITPYGVEDKRYLDKILDKINEVLNGN